MEFDKIMSVSFNDGSSDENQSLYNTPKNTYSHESCQHHKLKIVYITNTWWENIYTWQMRVYTPTFMMYIINNLRELRRFSTNKNSDRTNIHR